MIPTISPNHRYPTTRSSPGPPFVGPVVVQGLLLGEALRAPVDRQEAAELLEVQLAVPVLVDHRQRLRARKRCVCHMMDELNYNRSKKIDGFFRCGKYNI